MPYGLPAATTTRTGADCPVLEAATLEKTGIRFVPRGTKVELLHRGADQDGFLGQIICRTDGLTFAAHPHILNL